MSLLSSANCALINFHIIQPFFLHDQHIFTRNIPENFRIIFNFFPHPIRCPDQGIKFTKIIFILQKSWRTMLVNGKIRSYCGVEHCILSVQVHLSTFTRLTSNLMFDQDWKSCVLNHGELRTDESFWSIGQTKLPIAAYTDGEIRRDWPLKIINSGKAVLFVNTFAQICRFDFNINCIYYARLKAWPCWNWSQAFSKE